MKPVVYRNIEQIICNETVDFVTIGKVPQNLNLLIGTTNGLYIFYRNMLMRLLECNAYGITKYNDDCWYVYINSRKFAKSFTRICCMKIKNKKVQSIVEKYKVPAGMHQIDFVDDALWMANTHKNSILIYGLHQKSELFPSGQLYKSRYLAKNYRHFNSIFRREGRVYVLAHNVFHYSKNKSQIYIFTLSGKLSDIIDVDGENCHNIYIENNKMFTCNSSYGSLLEINSGKEISLGLFTRGLAVSDSYIMVGGSPDQVNRDKREADSDSNSIIYILDKNSLSVVGQVIFNGPHINEIRNITGGKEMSNYIRRQQ